MSCLASNKDKHRSIESIERVIIMGRVFFYPWKEWSKDGTSQKGKMTSTGNQVFAGGGVLVLSMGWILHNTCYIVPLSIRLSRVSHISDRNRFNGEIIVLRMHWTSHMWHIHTDQRPMQSLYYIKPYYYVGITLYEDNILLLLFNIEYGGKPCCRRMKMMIYLI